MMLSAGIVVVVVVAALWLARPFLRPVSVETSESTNAISIFRDQLDEVRRDRDIGLITEAERDAAEEEIERRALRASRRMDAGLAVAKRSPAAAAAAVLFVAAASTGTYLAMGTPEAPDQPLAERRMEALQQRASAGDVNSRIALLIERTKENPDGFEGWWMLARSYSTVGDHASAADAYRRAAELSDENPAVLSAYAEAMTLANGNKVPTAARLIFERLNQFGNGDPRARYYVALAKAQRQDFAGALADWQALLHDSKADAPWTRIVRRDIVNMARFLKRDVRTVLPNATPAEIAKAGGKTTQNADTGQRIDHLERSLEAEPKNYKGWIALAELRAAAGDDKGALAAIESARGHYAGAPFVIGKLDQAARQLGLDHLASAGEQRGPTDADVAAAAQMSESDRAQMIEGMVAGLAARLEEQPDDLNGWAMLIRSYTVLGNRQKAEQAVNDALGVFAEDARASNEIKQIASNLGLGSSASN